MNSKDLHDEKDLLNRVAEGDEAAYRILFEQYWPRVYSTALLFSKVPEVAEDAAQDVFAKLWQKRALLAGVKQFRSYLFMAARNAIFDKLKAKVFTGDFNAYLEEYFSDPFADPVSKIELKQAGEIIEAGIGRLPPQQQKVFRMSRQEGLSHAEIAKATGLSVRTVKNYMVSALLSMRNYLGEHSGLPVIFLWILIYL